MRACTAACASDAHALCVCVRACVRVCDVVESGINVLLEGSPVPRVCVCVRVCQERECCIGVRACVRGRLSLSLSLSLSPLAELKKKACTLTKGLSILLY